MVPETTHRVKQFGHWGGSMESRASSMVGMLRPAIVHHYELVLDDDFLDEMARRLVSVPGVVAIALGGSRASGTHTATRHHQLGHPFGVPEYAYAAEVALGGMLADPTGRLGSLMNRMQMYPAQLAGPLVRRQDDG